MKKPFKLNAYYLVDGSGIDDSDATRELGIPLEWKAVIFLDPTLYIVDEDGAVNCPDLACWLFYSHERHYCKRCDNKFVVGVRYKSIHSGEIFTCYIDCDNHKAIKGEQNYSMYCEGLHVSDYTPVVGAIG